VRNYNTFFIFVLSVVIALCGVELSCILHISYVMVRLEPKYGFGTGLGMALSDPPPENIIISFVLGGYALVGIGPVVFLLLFHMLLVSRNVTTNEYLKGLYNKGKTSPFSRGFFLNFITILFPICWPSYLQPREIMENEPPP